MVGREMRLRNKKGQFTGKLDWRIPLGLLLMAGILAMLNWAVVSFNTWSDTHGLQRPWVFNMEFYTRGLVYDRPELEVISPIVEIESSDIPIDNPIDQKIYDLWGDRYFLLARSVFKCESGLDPEAVNWSTQDIGVAQINWPTWEKKVSEIFGYTLKDMFDYEKNLNVAHWIWENDNSSFRNWVVYINGAFIGCVE